MAQPSNFQYACIVNHGLGGRIFVECGDKGDKDGEIKGFVSAVVNKRPDAQGSFVQGTHAFSYLKGIGGKYSFVVLSAPTVETDVVWALLNEISEGSNSTEDKAVLTSLVEKTLAKYQSVTTKAQLEELKKQEVAVVASQAQQPAAGPLEPVTNFFHAVVDKTKNRDPGQSPDAVKHFFESVEKSYKEQGGNETVVKVLNDVGEIAKKEMHKLEEKGLEVGGVLLDTYEKFEKDVSKSGGYTNYLKKEFDQFEQVVQPKVHEASNVIMAGGMKVGEALVQGYEDFEKGILQEKMKAEAEVAMTKGMEVTGALIDATATLTAEIQSKGVQEVLITGWTALLSKLSKKKQEEDSDSGFGSDESFN